MTEMANCTSARSHSLSMHYLLSRATQTRVGCTIADFVASVGENGDRDHCLGASVASLGINAKMYARLSIHRDSAVIDSTRGCTLPLAPIILQ